MELSFKCLAFNNDVPKGPTTYEKLVGAASTSMPTHSKSETMKNKGGTLQPYAHVNASTAFQTVDFDTDANCGRSEETELAGIGSGLHKTESTQA